jgi:hypothetical protein
MPRLLFLSSWGLLYLYQNFGAVLVNAPELYRYWAISPSRRKSMIAIKIIIIFAKPSHPSIPQ